MTESCYVCGQFVDPKSATAFSLTLKNKGHLPVDEFFVPGERGESRYYPGYGQVDLVAANFDPDPTDIDSYGQVWGGFDVYAVFRVRYENLSEKFFRIDGVGDSYGDLIWNLYAREVTPVEKTVVVYE